MRSFYSIIVGKAIPKWHKCVEGESQPVTASTVANLKEVVIPSEKVAVYSDMSTVLAASNQTFFYQDIILFKLIQ